jgi:hypothetical protein
MIFNKGFFRIKVWWENQIIYNPHYQKLLQEKEEVDNHYWKQSSVLLTTQTRLEKALDKIKILEEQSLKKKI